MYDFLLVLCSITFAVKRTVHEKFDVTRSNDVEIIAKSFIDSRKLIT